ncbi:beta-1,3-galactosyltransferase 1-like [Mercenaria mercenaria]|uniref:beta-1,3-galactosyltransferase 1-like n=1 Tax=Mercenaria mercenaria TaxID=6596 RepID=UPI00234E3ABC|nr:beta-1,3-galactosyltransferase 1-like [Mercenaria mercenaria]
MATLIDWVRKKFHPPPEVGSHFLRAGLTQRGYSKTHYTLIKSRYESTMFSYKNVSDRTKHISTVRLQEEAGKELKFPVKMQPNLVRLINWTNPKYPMNVKFVLENKEICVFVKKLTVLVVVNSATNHYDRKQAIRKTWANDTHYAHLGTARVLFLLGRSVNPSVQIRVEKEFKEYGDILQGDFIDGYLNLTFKGVMCYKWLTERCRNAKMILKSDDDLLVNMFVYFRKLDELLPSTNVYCEFQRSVIFRNKRNKWYVSKNHFRGETFYDRYCTGKFVSMKNDIIPSLYISATKTPFFPYDHVLLFGYVMGNVQGLGYETIGKKNFDFNNNMAMKCLKDHKNKCSKFIMSACAEEMEVTWFTILKYFR